MKIINKTLKKLSQTMMLSFLLAPIFISSTQAFADSVGGVQTPEQAEKLRQQEKDKLEKYLKASKDAEEFNKNGSTQLTNAVNGTKQYSNVLTVTQNPTKEIHVTPDEYWNKKAELQKNYDTQTKDILDKTQAAKDLTQKEKDAQAKYDEAYAKYKEDYAAWEKETKQFLEKTASETGWSVQQVLDFLGKDLPNVSYVSAGKDMTFDKGSLRSFSQSELNSILSNSKVDPGLKNYLKTKEWGNLYKLEQGVSWKYINVFKDTKTGKMVDVKVTIQGLGNNYSNKYGLPPMIMVGEKYIGTDVAGIGAVRYGLEFFEHGTDKKVTIPSLLGAGDIDYNQSIAVFNATSVLRGSKNKEANGKDYLGSISTGGDDTTEGKDSKYQSWFLLHDVDNLSYVFSAADPAWGQKAPDGSDFMGFYHQMIGGIPLPIKQTPPTKPTPPTFNKTRNPIFYNDYTLIVDKPKINVIPKPIKDVAIGNVDGSIKESANGKTVLKGQQLTYTLDTVKFSNLRKDQSKIEWKDTLPNEVTFNALKVETPEGKDISNQFEINHQGQLVTVKAKPEYLQIVNKDKSQEFALAVPHVYVTVNKDNADFKNNYTILLDSGEFLSNEVENKTPGFTTKKQVFDDNLKNIDKQMVRRNQVLNYVGDLDLTKLDNLAISDDLLEKGISLTDNFDSKRLEVSKVTKDSLKVYLADDSKAKGLGQEIDSNDYKVDWTDTSWKVSLVKDKQVISKYAGKKLRILFKPTVKQTAEGTIYNKVIPNYFGGQIESNRVENPVSYEVMPQTGSKKLLIISGITIGLILTSVVGIVLYKKK